MYRTQGMNLWEENSNLMLISQAVSVSWDQILISYLILFVFTMNEMAEVPEPHIKFRFSFGGVEIRSSFHLRIFAKSLSFTHPSGNLVNTQILLRTKSLVVVENVFICFVSEIYWTITLALKGKPGFWCLSNRQTSYYRRTALKTMLKNPWGDTHGACEEIK